MNHSIKTCSRSILELKVFCEFLFCAYNFNKVRTSLNFVDNGFYISIRSNICYVLELLIAFLYSRIQYMGQLSNKLFSLSRIFTVSKSELRSNVTIYWNQFLYLIPAPCKLTESSFKRESSLAGKQETDISQCKGILSNGVYSKVTGVRSTNFERLYIHTHANIER